MKAGFNSLPLADKENTKVLELMQCDVFVRKARKTSV